MATLVQGLATAEAAVIGLGRSGASAARLLHAHGAPVYVSDSADSEALRETVAALGTAGIAAQAGGHDLARIARAGVVVVSPGVPPDAPPLETARRAGVPVISEVELALRAMPRVPYVATTGTNGKTTVTALIGHLMRAVGVRAVEGGNIGTPLSEIATRAAHPDWMSIELSSFQLHDTPSVAPRVAVLTNLAPDHLDRYPSLEAYYADKDLLFRNADGQSVQVVNGDDAEVLRRTAGLPGLRLRFSLREEADAWFDAASQQLMVAGAALLPRVEFPLLGQHNVANALAAALAVHAALPDAHGDDGRAKLAEGLRSFTPPPHRLERVTERDGVLWINDSKATNIGAALVAIEAMERPTVLLLGGKHKGEPYTALLEAMAGRVKAVVAYGEAEPLIVKDLAGHVPVERGGSSFPHVMALARRLASPGDAVLLAPACSSFDMFRNYEERGAQFRAGAESQ